MKRIVLTLFTILSLHFLSAQISFNTGSVEFDADLNVINTNANKDLPSFKTDLSVSFGVSVATIDNMFAIGMSAGDVYIGLEISNTTSKPVSDIITSYRKNKGKGWGVIAQEMGIKPGSDEFFALKGKCKNKKDKGNSKGNGNSNGKSNK